MLYTSRNKNVSSRLKRSQLPNPKCAIKYAALRLRNTIHCLLIASAVPSMLALPPFPLSVCLPVCLPYDYMCPASSNEA